MSLHTIAVLVGSLRRESLNRKLAHAMAALAPPGFTFEQLQIDDLPLDQPFPGDGFSRPTDCRDRIIGIA